MTTLATVWRAWSACAVTGLLAMMPQPICAAETDAAAQVKPGEATISLAPARYLDGATRNARSRMTGRYTGDGWTWHARFPMHGFLDAYLATRDPAWLDAAVTYFDWNVSLLIKGPDGYEGWLGPVAGQEGRLGEHPIGDAIMLEPMVRFAELVLKDEPALTGKYGERAKVYAGLARRVMFEKWEKRGTWHEDGLYGVFTEWPWYYTEAAADRWHEPDPGARAITLPFNMQVEWGIAAARLWRITGEAAWREKAERLFRSVKSRMCVYEDHFAWNYWEPFGPWDLKPGNDQEFLHWIGTHPYRDYQEGEVAAIVEAYHRGIVFSADDMRRLVATNTKVMWKGGLDDIQWNNSDAGVKKAATGEVRLASKPAGMFNRYAGTLWASLAGFDPTVRAIDEKLLKPGTYQWAYYWNVTKPKAPSYDRHYGDAGATVFDFPFHSCSTLTMAAVMPSVVKRGRGTLIACLPRVAGDLRVDLYSADGKDRVATIRDEAKQGAAVLNVRWDAADTPAGSYRVRWTLGGQYREFPITVE